MGFQKEDSEESVASELANERVHVKDRDIELGSDLKRDSLRSVTSCPL
jgi:hypothetical protein